MINKQKLRDIVKFSRLFIKYLRIHLKDTMVLRVAASLSYTTLIAVVPLLAIALAIFSAFPVYQSIRAQVQDFLIHYFVPDIGQNVQNYMIEFIGASAQLTTIGVIGIAVTAILLLSTIENSFNFIFKVKKHRSLATKITLYWTIITLCPLLLGAAFSLKGYIVTIKYFSNENLTDFNFVTSVILQNLLTFSVLLLSYIVVPNKKIRLSSAVFGALVAFLSMTVLRHSFGYFLVLNVTYKTLYGALASFPILLIWMYLWWTAILFGAVFTSVLEEFRNKKRLWK